MIYDTLDHIAAYRGLGANMDRAIDYLLHTDLSALSVGRHEVDGENVYVSIQEPRLRTVEEGRYEAHRRYADIQLCLADGEGMAWQPIEKLEGWEPYNPEKDVCFTADKRGAQPMPVPAGTFMIFLPGDAHMPNLKIGDAATGRKAVVKVLL